ncbi:hypothetical protein BU17DRAFT_98008 [Hysterangium stoloniferum]|nr:hypothetical protein BU17DRAFT_98008 [Hysterangium stoloniferum]
MKTYLLTTSVRDPGFGRVWRTLDTVRRTGRVAPVINIKPVYFPTWLVDACSVSQGKFDFVSEMIPDPEYFAYQVAHEIYYPGHHMFPLNMLPLTPSSPFLFSTPPVPWDESMATLPDPRSVTCLPYTRSPLTFVDDFKAASRYITVEGARKSTRFSISLLPLYPVLFPLYLIQFEAMPQGEETRNSQLTIVVAAHQPNGHMFATNLGKDYLHPSNSWIKLWEWFLGYKKEISLTATSGLDGTFIRDSPEAVSLILDIFTDSAGSSISVYGPRSEFLPDTLWSCVNFLHETGRRDESLYTQFQLKITTSWKRKPPEEINWDDERIRPAAMWEMTTNTAFQQQKRMHLQNQARILSSCRVYSGANNRLVSAQRFKGGQ